jgi:hypothetical protein
MSMSLIWWYASRNHFLAEELDADAIRMVKVRLYAAPLMFLLAIPFAFISSTAVILVWWLSPLGVMAVMRIFARHPHHK